MALCLILNLLFSTGGDLISPLNPGQGAYGWYDVQKLSADQSIFNAENYVFYCLLAALADRGWRLSKRRVMEEGGKLVQDNTLRHNRKRAVGDLKDLDWDLPRANGTTVVISSECM